MGFLLLFFEPDIQIQTILSIRRVSDRPWFSLYTHVYPFNN